MKNIITLFMTMAAITTYARQATAPGAFSQSKADSGKVYFPKSPKAPLRGKAKSEAFANGPFASPVSVQVLIGSQGIGADVKYGFLPKLSGRAGFGLVPVTVNNIFGFSSFSTANQLSARFANLHLLADYSPFSTGIFRNFRVVAGAGYVVKGDATLVVTPTGNYQLGSTTITHDEIGVLNAEVSWKGIAPYFGFSAFRPFPGKLFNINFDIGTYYLSSPATSLTGTKLLSDNSSQQPQFNKNMEGYHWLPVLQLNFNFRIK